MRRAMRRFPSFWAAAAALLLLLPARAGAQENSDCLECHSDRSLTGTRNGRTISVFVDEKKFAASVHASLDCTGCHADLEGKELPHDEDLGPAQCGSCHEAEQAQ